MLISEHICSELILNLQWHLSGTLGHPDLLLRCSKSSGSAGWKNNLSEKKKKTSSSLTQRENYSGHAKSLTLHMQELSMCKTLTANVVDFGTEMQSLNTGQPLPQPQPCDKQQIWTPVTP